jgi:hypothetical protein
MTASSLLQTAQTLSEQNAPREARLVFFGMAQYAYGEGSLSTEQINRIVELLGMSGEAEDLIDSAMGLEPETA